MESNKRGLFISIEGINDDIMEKVVESLEEELKNERNKKVAVTGEPGGTDIANIVGDILRGNKLDNKTELFLFLAARRDHLQSKIIPSLLDYDYVISNRFCHSTFAYQGYGNGGNLNDIHTLNRYMSDGVLPDLTFYIDSPVSSLKDGKKAFSDEYYRYYDKVREGYLEMANSRDFGQIMVIDGEKSIKEMVLEIINYIGTTELALKMMKKSLPHGKATDDAISGNIIDISSILDKRR